MDSVPEILLILGVIGLFLGLLIFGIIAAKKRREAFQRIAEELGFTFNPGKDRILAKRLRFLNSMDDGRNRYCVNVLSGELNGHKMQIFDYHYETYSRDSDGKRKTNHHWYSIFTLCMTEEFPELVIKPEGVFAKFGQAIGFDDIDFESVEFSKRYDVRSKDKKFAYDFCNAQMIAYLLDQDKLNIEVEGSTLALSFRRKLSVDKIRPNIDRIQKIRTLMPNYLFTD
ncbi:MAG: hypothetical protein ACPGSB_01020 [Opitutales bacterium]